MCLVALTCTGDRPAAFALCERWMHAQTRRPDRWIVVDDGATPTRCTLGQDVLRLPPMDGCSLRRNLAAGLSRTQPEDVVVFVEDDDWYAPHHLENVEAMLAAYPDTDLLGSTPAHYFRVDIRCLRSIHGTHASLCATSVRRGARDLLREIVAIDGSPFVDLKLWSDFERDRSLLEVREGPRVDGVPGRGPLVVGIKGMPGRAGAGSGHRMDGAPDPTLERLRSWMGDDAEAYAPFYRSASGIAIGSTGPSVS